MTPRSLLFVFTPYVLVSAVHVVALFSGHPLAPPTKLLLMPLLAFAVAFALLTAGRDSSWQTTKKRIAWATAAILLFGIIASWLGDGSGTFFPMFADELPMMLACFGIAHLAYMWIFWKSPAIRTRTKLPRWVALYGVLYLALIAVLVPHTGALTVPVVLYGLVLVGTATLSTLVNTTVAWGGFWFLMSDAILSLRIFMSDLMPGWTGGVVMLTYTLGQLLIAYGVTKRLIDTRSEVDVSQDGRR